MPEPHSSDFSDRCSRTVFGNNVATRCSLELGHDGECLPTPLPRSSVVSPHSELFDAIREALSVNSGEELQSSPAFEEALAALASIEEQFEAQAARLDEFERLTEQACRDLNQAHDEIVRLQGGAPKKYDWPRWTPQANTIRWAERLLGKSLGKASSSPATEAQCNCGEEEACSDPGCRGPYYDEIRRVAEAIPTDEELRRHHVR